MKKFASGLIALTLVLGISTSAFAAVYPDNEPNNSKATANPFYPAHGNQINGSLHPVTDGHDYFAFTAAETKKVRFQLAYSKAGRQEFQLVFVNNGTTTPTKDYIDVNLEAGKNYWFRVEAISFNLDSPTNYNYSLYSYEIPN